MDLRDHRLSYQRSALDIEQINSDPIVEFKKWFQETLSSGLIKEPNAMIVSTVSEDLQPSSRVVLLKMISDQGLIFFTNYDSQKGKEIKQNHNISVLFFWPELEQQIRITGVVSKISDQESDEYFYSRPKESQMSALVSDQSQKIASKDILNQRLEKLQLMENLKRPANWGGYLISPTYFEFWQGRPNRLHDRVCYQKNDQNWEIGLLQP